MRADLPFHLMMLVEAWPTMREPLIGVDALDPIASHIRHIAARTANGNAYGTTDRTANSGTGNDAGDGAGDGASGDSDDDRVEQTHRVFVAACEVIFQLTQAQQFKPYFSPPILSARWARPSMEPSMEPSMSGSRHGRERISTPATVPQVAIARALLKLMRAEFQVSVVFSMPTTVRVGGNVVAMPNSGVTSDMTDMTSDGSGYDANGGSAAGEGGVGGEEEEDYVTSMTLPATKLALAQSCTGTRLGVPSISADLGDISLRMPSSQHAASCVMELIAKQWLPYYTIPAAERALLFE